jgi:catechol 2,3-dioxygenase
LLAPSTDEDGPAGASPVAGAVAHLGHVELLTPDLEASRACFVDVLGLREVMRIGDSVMLRGESEYELSGLTLTAAAQPGIGHLGLRARNAGALAERVAALRASGIEGRWLQAGPGHGPAFRFDGPAGHPIELYWETERYVPAPEDRPPARDRLARRGTAGVDVRRLDHVNLLAGDVRAAAALAWRHLGATLLDEVRGDDGSMSGAWMTLGQRPLELVYTRDAYHGAGRLHHVAFWVDTREEVLRAADIFVDRGVTIELPPAQHTIGRSFFLYGFEPGGNRIEITTGADLVLDPAPQTRIWTAAERRRGVGWGTAFPASWSHYGTPDIASSSPAPASGESGGGP